MEGLVAGRIVHYTLSGKDVDDVLRRRTNADGIRGRIDEGTWPFGAMAHIGNKVVDGDILAAVVVKVHPDDKVNLRVLLDGTDVLWVQEVGYFEDPAAQGTWRWIPRA